MAAATRDREVSSRTPGNLIPYSGASGYNYLVGCMTMRDITGAIIRPMVQGAGASNARFLGINRNRVDLTAGLGSSQAILDIYKTGVFTLLANGTGSSTDIGKVAYALDDQTVGISIAAPCLAVGEITGFIDTSTYRVRIDNFVGRLPGALELGISTSLNVN